MTGYRKRTEGTKVSTIAKSNETERDDDEEDCLFMNMPSKEKGGIATERYRTDEILPSGLDEESD